ncbi:hypothetical protein [Hoyosella altamirensis]|uniref:Uncharacterized protein n=1 Tax=Hoyosella altamirensis TaxID=616997 RepID=A0A839RP61_9ACTN|nr:hypothetical protein [Hoyosella altamirensis]MBB3038167.1 hypothetical protein [Hoyosella altamirensis]
MSHQFAVFGATILMGAFVGVVFFVIALAVWFGLRAMKIRASANRMRVVGSIVSILFYIGFAVWDYNTDIVVNPSLVVFVAAVLAGHLGAYLILCGFFVPVRSQSRYEA